MKNYLVGLLFILVTISCTTKKENEHKAESKLITSGPMGVNNNGEYQIIGIDTISQKWEAQLKESFGLSDSISFSKFEIIKTTTQGDATEDSYLLLTHTSNKLSAIAVILDLKGNDFYFYTKLRGTTDAKQVIMCNGSNGGPSCTPVVILQNKEKRLICSSDSDCEKIVSEVSL